jgi:hypothetical protein
MRRSFFARSGIRYQLVSPGSVYESSVTALVDSNARALFPDYECRRIEPYFHTAAGDVKPDLVLIRRSTPGWALVEVEAEEHSARGHVKPQIAKLRFARGIGLARAAIEMEFLGAFTGDHLDASLALPPAVYLVTHGSTRVTESELRQLAVHSIDLEILRGGPNEYVIAVTDDSDRLLQLASGAQRMPSPMLRGVWQVLTPHIEVMDEAGSPVVVDFDGIIGTWSVSRTTDGYLLRMPSGLFDEIEATHAQVFVDQSDGTVLMRAVGK